MDNFSRFDTWIEELFSIELEDTLSILEKMIENEIESFEEAHNGYDDEEEGDEEEPSIQDYNSEFGLVFPDLYMLEKGREVELDYQERMDDTGPGQFRERLKQCEEADIPSTLDFSDQGSLERTEYRNMISQVFSVGMKRHLDSAASAVLMNIEYDTPELINNQRTYQRLVFQADREGETVYELTTRKLKGSGIEISSKYDPDFNSMLFTSINKKKEGAGGNFNEFYMNGEIGQNAVDKENVKKGDIIEWRYAEESDGTCGGVPDFNYIKSMIQQRKIIANFYMNFQQPEPFSPVSHFHSESLYAA